MDSIDKQFSELRKDLEKRFVLKAEKKEENAPIEKQEEASPIEDMLETRPVGASQAALSLWDVTKNTRLALLLKGW